ncbi:MAG: hypothetical protein J0M13_17415 [Candidatus Accumulibacter sp.]|nr:hypothetical protein [Candidatus Accumulibacter necessarius]
MELVPIRKRFIGLDVHQAQVAACAIIKESAQQDTNRATAIWCVRTGTAGSGGLGGGT